LDSLNELGLIEDSHVPSTYSSTELERYQANLNYFSGVADLETSKYTYQDKLRNSRVAILGLGGGSLVASYLAGLGIGEIIGVDYDVVERTNLNRQFLFNEADIGRLKSDVVEQKLKAINPEISVKMYNRKVMDYTDVMELISGCDAVICMLDQPAVISTRWVNAACVKLGIPYYRGGVNNQSIFWMRTNPNLKEPCFDCHIIHSLQTDPNTYYRLKSNYGKTFSQVNTGFAPNLSILTGYFILDLTNYLTGIGNMMKPMASINLTDIEMIHEDNDCSKKECCPTCSGPFVEMSTLDDLIKIAHEEVCYET
jgi:molybdopterin/thiamine biosynthesis adenylyltransferase